MDNKKIHLFKVHFIVNYSLLKGVFLVFFVGCKAIANTNGVNRFAVHLLHAAALV